jgi:nucleotide-binding universal stress UspA family protein
LVEESNMEEREWVQSVIGMAWEALGGTGPGVSAIVKEGDPKKPLVEGAEEWNADSIFVASTGTSSRFDRFLPGSVWAAVVARAHCSVGVVRGRVDESA